MSLSHKERKWLDKATAKAIKISGADVVCTPVPSKAGSSHRKVSVEVDGQYTFRLPYSISSLTAETIDNFSKQIRRAYRLRLANQ